MLESFLAGDPSDEKQVRRIRINAVPLERASGIGLPVLIQIDPIVNHIHPRRINVEQTLDVAFGFTGHSDDRIGHFQRSFLYPKRKVIAARELLALPWPKRFERMDRNDKRDAVILFRQNSAKMSVPRMTMHQVGIDVGDRKSVV